MPDNRQKKVNTRAGKGRLLTQWGKRMEHMNPRVLIVDDEQVVCDVLRDELSDRGYLCTTVLDGNDALAKLATEHFDVVLLDIKLPGMSGMEVLRNMPLGCHIAIIMITAVNDVDTVVEAMKLGASDYIVKPFNVDSVDASIRAVSVSNKGSAQEKGYETAVGAEEWSKQDGKEGTEWFRCMNAIAFGVEVRHDFLTGFSEAVTEETVIVARGLDIPENEIQSWVNVRTILDCSRKKTIESSFTKLQRSPFGQALLGGAQLPWHQGKPREARN